MSGSKRANIMSDADRFFDVSAALATWDEPQALVDFLGSWADKGWMNTPGPLYCSDGDNCGTGPLQAPNNVGVDAEGCEVIFRQPINRFELQQVVRAAGVDPLHGYGLDGDAHWSRQSIRAWWAEQRRDVERVLEQEYQRQMALGDKKDYAYSSGLAHRLDCIRHGM
jgi:hypothetical protein